MKNYEMMDGLIVDNFAGGGGASTGIERAFGRSIDVAINHDEEAVAMHAANHPNTRHICQSVWKADPAEVAGGQPVALAWFSPDCKHFSKAKGKPIERKKEIRDLAWVVVSWAQRVQPTVIILENVEEFRQWAPLGADGMPAKPAEQIELIPQDMPRPARRRMKREKPNGETFELWVAALKREGYRVEWKELRGCWYGAPTIRKRLFVIARCDGEPIVWPAPTHGEGLIPYKTAATDVIDWSIPCPSIFERDRELADATKRRIAAGIMRFVVNNPRPFIVPTTNRTWGGDRAHDGLEPLRTVQASSGGDFAVVMPTLLPVTHQGSASRVYDPQKPLNSVTGANRGEIALAVAHLDRQFGKSIGAGADQPAPTTTAGGSGKTALVTAFLAQHQGDKAGAARAGRPADQPISAIVHRGTQQGVVVAHIMQNNSERGGKAKAGRPASEPLSTATATGAQQSVVTTHLMQLRGTCETGRPADEPTWTPTAQGTHIAEVRAFLVKYFGTAVGQDVDQPAHTATSKARFGLVTVTIEGEEYVITDIGMRMLTPRELARAQGFPDSYILDPWVRQRDRRGKFKDRRLTKTSQVRMIGNSVNPDVAEALVRANCRKPATKEERIAA